MDQLRQEAEALLGTAISPPEWNSARGSAERKLAHIIALCGDSAGMRREPWYLAQLIAEAVCASRTTRHFRSRFYQSGTKKEQPTHYA